jgi:hypothetical protein
MHVDVEIPLGVAFENGRNVVDTLDWIGERVAVVIRAFWQRGALI